MIKLRLRAALVGTVAIVAITSLLTVGALTWTSAARATTSDNAGTDSLVTDSQVADPTATPTATPVAPPVAPAPVVVSPPRVLTIGDSIMKGFGLDPVDAWPELISATNGWNLDTLACDGAGFVAPGSSRECGDTFVDVSRSAATLAPDIIIIEGSSNDFGQSNSQLLSATVSALTILRSEFPNAEIIGLSTVWSETTPPAQLADTNFQVQQAVEAVGGHYLDIGQPLGGHPELMQGDDVHPTIAGQEVLASAVQTAVAGEQQAIALQQKLQQEQVEKLTIMGRWVD